MLSDLLNSLWLSSDDLLISRSLSLLDLLFHLPDDLLDLSGRSSWSSWSLRLASRSLRSSPWLGRSSLLLLQSLLLSNQFSDLLFDDLLDWFGSLWQFLLSLLNLLVNLSDLSSDLLSLNLLWSRLLSSWSRSRLSDHGLNDSLLLLQNLSSTNKLSNLLLKNWFLGLRSLLDLLSDLLDLLSDLDDLSSDPLLDLLELLSDDLSLGLLNSSDDLLDFPGLLLENFSLLDELSDLLLQLRLLRLWSLRDCLLDLLDLSGNLLDFLGLPDNLLLEIFNDRSSTNRLPWSRATRTLRSLLSDLFLDDSLLLLEDLLLSLKVLDLLLKYRLLRLRSGLNLLLDLLNLTSLLTNLLLDLSLLSDQLSDLLRNRSSSSWSGLSDHLFDDSLLGLLDSLLSSEGLDLLLESWLEVLRSLLDEFLSLLDLLLDLGNLSDNSLLLLLENSTDLTSWSLFDSLSDLLNSLLLSLEGLLLSDQFLDLLDQLRSLRFRSLLELLLSSLDLLCDLLDFSNNLLLLSSNDPLSWSLRWSLRSSTSRSLSTRLSLSDGLFDDSLLLLKGLLSPLELSDLLSDDLSLRFWGLLKLLSILTNLSNNLLDLFGSLLILSLKDLAELLLRSSSDSLDNLSDDLLSSDQDLSLSDESLDLLLDHRFLRSWSVLDLLSLLSDLSSDLLDLSSDLFDLSLDDLGDSSLLDWSLLRRSWSSMSRSSLRLLGFLDSLFDDCLSSLQGLLTSHELSDHLSNRFSLALRSLLKNLLLLTNLLSDLSDFLGDLLGLFLQSLTNLSLRCLLDLLSNPSDGLLLLHETSLLPLKLLDLFSDLWGLLLRLLLDLSLLSVDAFLDLLDLPDNLLFLLSDGFDNRLLADDSSLRSSSLLRRLSWLSNRLSTLRTLLLNSSLLLSQFLDLLSQLLLSLRRSRWLSDLPLLLVDLLLNSLNSSLPLSRSTLLRWLLGRSSSLLRSLSWALWLTSWSLDMLSTSWLEALLVTTSDRSSGILDLSDSLPQVRDSSLDRLLLLWRLSSLTLLSSRLDLLSQISLTLSKGRVSLSWLNASLSRSSLRWSWSLRRSSSLLEALLVLLDDRLSSSSPDLTIGSLLSELLLQGSLSLWLLGLLDLSSDLSDALSQSLESRVQGSDPFHWLDAVLLRVSLWSRSRSSLRRSLLGRSWSSLEAFLILSDNSRSFLSKLRSNSSLVLKILLKSSLSLWLLSLLNLRSDLSDRFSQVSESSVQRSDPLDWLDAVLLRVSLWSWTSL